MPPTTHPELHRTERIGWLRAAVLGANDGIVSTASLVVGVAAAGGGMLSRLAKSKDGDGKTTAPTTAARAGWAQMPASAGEQVSDDLSSP
jgi:VIT family